MQSEGAQEFLDGVKYDEEPKTTTIDQSMAWKRLRTHLDEEISETHLRDLTQDELRANGTRVEHGGIMFDYSRQRVTLRTMDFLFDLAEEAEVKRKLNRMVAGFKVNKTEGRAVMHMALRAPADGTFMVDDANVVPQVHEVLESIRLFSEKVRTGTWKGATGKRLKNIISVGIGGSYLGPEFVYEALRCDAEGSAASAGRQLRFLANVDPVDVRRAMQGLDPEETMVVVVSKTFTTAETMLNARTLRDWLQKAMPKKNNVTSLHMCAVSASVPGAKAFGIEESNVFGFWDWVGGRYSVCSAVGVMPLALHYGFGLMRKFLDGAADIDNHFINAPPRQNIPFILGLLGVWNSSFLGHGSRALLPYSQALLRFPAHIQQVDMESNGKRVTQDGLELPFDAGEVDFGEPGTNGQHSFYQLIHQGRVVPCDFIGFCESQCPLELEGEAVSNHDELMSNFFAQPDALARGKTLEDLEKEGVPVPLRPHKVFPGNRPSSSLLLPRLDAFSAGQLLAIYEHRTAVQGIVWDLNSFDQWGVELGKVLAKQVRSSLQGARKKSAPVTGFSSSTTTMMNHYLSGGGGAGAAGGASSGR